MTLLKYEVLDSTNREAARRIMAGQTENVVIVADCQTAGQGRYDRQWESRPSLGLWISIIRTIEIDLQKLSQATLVAAVAVAEGIEKSSGLAPQVKWPNDLLVNGGKLCGILVENPGAYLHSAQTNTHTLVFGIGINVSHQQADFAPELAQKATSLSLTLGREIDKENLLTAIIEQLDKWLVVWTSRGFEDVRKAWLARNCTIGQRVLLSDAAASDYGEAIGISPSGTLTIRLDSGVIQNVDTGEIQFCPPDNLSTPL